jgi:hypothetical protein
MRGIQGGSVVLFGEHSTDQPYMATKQGGRREMNELLLLDSLMMTLIHFPQLFLAFSMPKTRANSSSINVPRLPLFLLTFSEAGSNLIVMHVTSLPHIQAKSPKKYPPLFLSFGNTRMIHKFHTSWQLPFLLFRPMHHPLAALKYQILLT